MSSCGEDCPDGYDTDGITLTIAAPADTDCDGSEKTASITGYPETAPESLAAAPADTDIEYYMVIDGSDNVMIEGAPSEAGDFVASITWGGATASVPFTLVEPIIDVRSVTLDKPAAQTITVGARAAFTATVAPNNATDKMVKWSVSGTDAGAVKLYTNADCTEEVGTEATDITTVYVKGISVGSARFGRRFGHKSRDSVFDNGHVKRNIVGLCL